MQLIPPHTHAVIIPTYNGSRFLADTLRSLASQTVPPSRVILIDDGSNDSSVSIAQTFHSSLPLEVHPKLHSGNWVKRTNEAIEAANCDYTSILHQDDLWAPSRMERVIELINKYPDAGLYVHQSYFVDKDGRGLGPYSLPFPQTRTLLTSRNWLTRLSVQNSVAVCAATMRTDLVRALGGFDELLWFTADWKMWIQLGLQSPVAFTPERLGSFRIHTKSQTMTGGDGSELEDQYRRVLTFVLEAAPLTHDEHRTLSVMGDFSIVMNRVMADMMKGSFAGTWHICRSRLWAHPSWLLRYLRYSRFIERTFSRVRARLPLALGHLYPDRHDVGTQLGGRPEIDN